MPKNLTRHLKAPKGGETTSGMRMHDDWNKRGKVDPMQTASEHDAIAKAAARDEKAGRVTKKPLKKDQSRLTPGLSVGGYMSGPDWEPGSKKK